jgi:hypothetical protein
MTIIRRSFVVLLITSVILISCGDFSTDTPEQVAPTLSLPSFTPSSKPPAKTTLTPSATAIISIAPSPTNVPICVAPFGAAETDGWDCLNQSYGFTVHFPSTAKPPMSLGSSVIVSLINSSSNPRVERMLSISLGQTAESCISPDSKTTQIGEQIFMVDHGFEPSGVVYEWRSYAITKESKSVCFLFTVGFQTWEQDDPLFPPEKDQGLDEVEAILATFQWLNP